jgi:small subunit ribosomal protein S16
MLKIRLQRIGRKNDPAFRVVVTESSRGPKSGNHIELLGSYNPRQSTSRFDAERIKYWISKGAQVSGTIHNLLITEKIIEGKKVNVLPRKTPIVTAEEATETPAKVDEAQATVDAGTPVAPEVTADDAEVPVASKEARTDEAPSEVPPQAAVKSEEKPQV